MKCPHDKLELKRRYHIEDFINKAVVFEYDFCNKCHRHYDVNGNEILLTKDGYVKIKSGKKAKK